MLARVLTKCLGSSANCFRLVNGCDSFCFIHFDANAALKSHKQIDSYFKQLDNLFLEHSCLQYMQEVLNHPTTDKCFRMHFWEKFISSSVINGKDKILNSLVLYVLEKTESHSTPTLISVLRALAYQQRFEEFESLYSLIKSRLSSADSLTYSTELSSALCLSPFYGEAMMYLQLSLEHKLPTNRFSSILTAAATFGPLDEALSLIHEFHSLQLKPNPEFYAAFMKRLGDSSGLQQMVNLLEAVKKYDYVITNSTALLIKEWFERLGWRGTMGVHVSGLTCPSCLKHLNKIKFSSEFCAHLAEMFYNNVLKGKTADELFLTTTPKELDSFLQFMEYNKIYRFDCVVDLPNYLHLISHRNLSKTPLEEQISILSELISLLHRTYRFKRICLVGKERSVVKKKLFWDVIRSLGNRTGINVQTFLTDHKSNDDVFMIYLALWSGPDCHLLSGDEFRQHRFTIGPEAADLLTQWQTARQISIRKFHPISFNDPVLCDPRIQGGMKEGWHIPYDSGDLRPSYLPPNSWLCLRPQTS